MSEEDLDKWLDRLKVKGAADEAMLNKVKKNLKKLKKSPSKKRINEYKG
jgi:hypothetical protein